MILPIFVPVELEYQTTPIYVQKLGHILVNASMICNLIGALVVFSNIVDFFLWDDEDSDPDAVYLMLVFFTILLLFSMLTVLGTVKLSAFLMLVAWLTWLIALTVWLSEICVLFTMWTSYKSLCIGRRCPESLWLSDFYYRAFDVVEDSLETSTTEPPTAELVLKKNYLFLSLSIFTFVLFLFYFTMLGSLTWNMYMCLKLLGPYLGLPTLVPPAGYIFMLPFRVYYKRASVRDSIALGLANTSAEEEGTSNAPVNEPKRLFW